MPAPDEPSRPWSSDDERRLSLYIEKEETLRAYIATLAACTNAQQVGEAVAQMCADEPKLNGDLIAKENSSVSSCHSSSDWRKAKALTTSA